MRPLRRWLRVALPILLAACGSEDREGWSGSTEVLENGVVRVTNPVSGLWSTGSEWRLTPELTIGEIEGDDAYVFGAISGLEVDSAGRILVLDRQVNELRIFGGDGVHIRSVGRSGEGPGEFANANGLAWVTPDTLLVVDQRGNRYSVFTRDGDYVRSVPRRLGFFGWVFSGGYLDRRIYETSSVGRGDDRQPALLGTSIESVGSRPAATGPGIDGRVEGLAAAAGDTVLLPVPVGPLYEAFSIQNERSGMVMAVPFTARPVYNLDATGHVWHGHGGAGSIFRTTLAGDTLMEIVLNGTPFPVTSEEISEWESGEGARQFRERGGTIDLGRIPEVKPHFDDIILDDRGNVWMGVPGGPDQSVFGVLDPDGRYLGRLVVNAVMREWFLRPVVRRGRLYFIGRDALDVQRVHIYRIEQSGGG